MEITIRYIGKKYRMVIIETISATIESSTLDQDECRRLAAKFEQAADELAERWD